MTAKSTKYQWASTGDINAFFGLLLDNIAGLVLIVSLLVGVAKMPMDFVLTRMIPGTAIGVLVGDILYFFLALYLAHKTKRPDITAMPLGLDTPSIFGIAIFVVGTAYKSAIDSGQSEADAATTAWHIGICCMFYSGIIKTFFSFTGSWIRRALPKAGLFGSLTSIALVIISFLPLVDVMIDPIVGIIALILVLVSLVGQVPLPWKIPGTVAALIVAGSIHYIQLLATGKPLLEGNMMDVTIMPTQWTEAFAFGWWQQMGAASKYLPIAIPFAIATVVGGIDCTESAAAAGDEYSTGHILGIEAIATLVAAVCGGITQTTPYIGHPAYKAMGGRAAYTLATAIVIGGVGILGGFSYFYLLIPKAAVFPILIFVGLEISSQSFIATPRRHLPALVLACVPALAFLSYFFVDQLYPAGLDDKIRPDLKLSLQTVQLLSHGFILSSLLWASALAVAIDRKLAQASIFIAIAGLFTLFGFIHSPLKDNAIFLPFALPGIDETWVLPVELRPSMWRLAIGYFLTSAMLALWDRFLKATNQDSVSGVGADI